MAILGGLASILITSSRSPPHSTDPTAHRRPARGRGSTSSSGSGSDTGLVAWVFAVTTLILAWVGSTERCIDAARLSVPVADGYGQPPYPTYG